MISQVCKPHDSVPKLSCSAFAAVVLLMLFDPVEDSLSSLSLSLSISLSGGILPRRKRVVNALFFCVPVQKSIT